jgi:WD40 repeat protein
MLLATGEDFPAGLLGRELRWEIHLPENLYAVRTSAFSSADLRYFVTIGGKIKGSGILAGDATVRLWERKEGTRNYTPNNLCSVAAFTDREFAIFSPDGRRIAVGSANDDLRVYDVGTLEIVLTVKRATFGGKELTGTPRFSSSGAHLLVKTEDAVFVVAIDPRSETGDPLASTCGRLRCGMGAVVDHDFLAVCR